MKVHGVQDLSFSYEPDFLNNKHLNFGQRLESLKFGQGYRGPNQQKSRRSTEAIRENEGKLIKQSIRKSEVETRL